jgi:hypothetical protein
LFYFDFEPMLLCGALNAHDEQLDHGRSLLFIHWSVFRLCIAKRIRTSERSAWWANRWPSLMYWKPWHSWYTFQILVEELINQKYQSIARLLTSMFTWKQGKKTVIMFKTSSFWSTSAEAQVTHFRCISFYIIAGFSGHRDIVSKNLATTVFEIKREECGGS